MSDLVGNPEDQSKAYTNCSIQLKMKRSEEIIETTCKLNNFNFLIACSLFLEFIYIIHVNAIFHYKVVLYLNN